MGWPGVCSSDTEALDISLGQMWCSGVARSFSQKCTSTLSFILLTDAYWHMLCDRFCEACSCQAVYVLS